MDLVTEPESAWFEFDDQYLAEMAEKRRLVATVRSDVFAATPQSDNAREEALTMIVAALTTHHPDWFSRDGTTALHNHLTGESWNIGSSDPLQLAGHLVQEDLCLIQNGEAGPVFTAASLCFPSRWRLLDKIGKPLAAVHGPVPLYAERLAGPVDRFMRNLKPNHIVSRLNWSLLDDPALFQPGGKWRVRGVRGYHRGKCRKSDLSAGRAADCPALALDGGGAVRRARACLSARPGDRPPGSRGDAGQRGPGIAGGDRALQEPTAVQTGAAEVAGCRRRRQVAAFASRRRRCRMNSV